MTESTTLPHDCSIVETCSILGVTPPTVYKLINRSELDSYKVGTSRRVTAESIARLRSGKSKGAA